MDTHSELGAKDEQDEKPRMRWQEVSAKYFLELKRLPVLASFETVINLISSSKKIMTQQRKQMND